MMQWLNQPGKLTKSRTKFPSAQTPGVRFSEAAVRAGK